MSFWSSVLPAAITAGASLWGASRQSDAQDEAAKIAAGAQGRATAAEVEANKQAVTVMQNQQRMASPGLLALQGIVGRGEKLTPAQELALEDARRTTLDALQGGSLRGSARATAATVNDVDGRMRTGFMDQNRSRADSAAGALSSQYFSSGNNIADLNLSGGKSVSSGLLNTGEINAANTLGQSNIQSRAIGDIGAIIADQMKSADSKKRDSSYEAINWNSERQGVI